MWQPYACRHFSEMDALRTKLASKCEELEEVRYVLKQEEEENSRFFKNTAVRAVHRRAQPSPASRIKAIRADREEMAPAAGLVLCS